MKIKFRNIIPVIRKLIDLAGFITHASFPELLVHAWNRILAEGFWQAFLQNPGKEPGNINGIMLAFLKLLAILILSLRNFLRFTILKFILAS
jgi:hypothetical protein